MLEIVRSKMSTERARLRHDCVAHVAVDEQPRTILREPFKRLGESLVAKGPSGLHQLAARCEDLGYATACGEDRGDDGEEVGLEFGQGETFARGTHRRLDQTFHWQRAKCLVPQEQPWHRARRRTGSKPDIELLLGRTEIGIDREERNLVWRPMPPRRLGEEIEQLHGVAALAPRHEETAAAGR